MFCCYNATSDDSFGLIWTRFARHVNEVNGEQKDNIFCMKHKQLKPRSAAVRILQKNTNL